MVRGLLSVAGLLAAMQYASADYIVIRINLAAGQGQPGPGPDPKPGNQMGGPRPGTQMGLPPPGGQNMGPGRPGNVTGLPSGPGATGLPPGGGVGGRPPGPGQMGGAVGVPPNTGTPPNIGMPPNIGVPPNLGGSNIGQPPPKPAGKQEWFLAVVEGEVRQAGSEVVIVHKWGRTPLDPRHFIEDRAYIHWQPAPPLERRVDQKAVELRREPFRFLEWMLENWNMPSANTKFSMRKRFEEHLEQMKRDDSIKPNSPQGVRLELLLRTRARLAELERSGGGIKADERKLEQVRNLVKKVNADDKVEWRALDSRMAYTIIHPDHDEKNAEQRAQRLDHFYAGFYYWFALQGKALEQPERRMICVLAKDVDQYKKLTRIFDEPPRAQDGFFSGIDNVVVFSPGRVDLKFVELESHARGFETNLKKDELSINSLWKGEPLPEKVLKELRNANLELATNIFYGRALGLAMRAAQEEGEIATITHEGVQQLVQVSGLLPRRVRMPESLRFGLASIFETPKSQAVGVLLQPAIWPGIATPHWLYLPLAHELIKNENKTIKVDGEREIPLGSLSILRVLNDQSFLDAEAADLKLRDFYLEKARAEAWSLNYFLAKASKSGGGRYLDDLLEFYKQLDQLPRDQDIPQQTRLRLFVRAFQLGHEQQPDALDPKKLEAMESDWKRFISDEKLRGIINMTSVGKQ
jgi:hypothetical protein